MRNKRNQGSCTRHRTYLVCKLTVIMEEDEGSETDTEDEDGNINME